MFKKIIFVVIAITIIVTGCSLFNFGGGDLIPLSVGNYWNIKLTMKTTMGTVVTDTTTYGRSEIIGKVTLANGKEAFAYKSGMTNSSYNFDTVSVYTIYITKEDTAYFSYDSLSQVTGDYQLPLKIDVGTGWYANDMKNEVTAKENVTVPAGTFNTYKIAITTTTSNDTSWQWVSQGNGDIKGYMKAGDSSYLAEMTYELTGYKVK